MDKTNMADVPVEESTQEDNGVVPADSPSDDNFIEDAKVENDFLDSSPEESEPQEETQETPSEEVKSEPEEAEENVPFHKHPRFKELTTRLKEYDEKFDTRVEERVREVLGNVSKAHEEGKDITKEIPDDFKELFGEDPKVYEKFSSFLGNVLKEHEEKTLQRLEEKQKTEKEQVEKANEHIDNEIKKLQESGKQFEKNELIKFMLEWEEQYGPQGIVTDGAYDFSKGLDLMNKFSPKEEVEDVERTRLADAASNRGKGTSSESGMSYEDMRRALSEL